MRLAAAAAAIAGVFLGLPVAALAQAIDLTGKYVMEGRMDGQPGALYKGECDLKRVGGHYEAFCVNGEDKYTGKGVVSGEIFSLYLGEYLVIYRIDAGGKLSGAWVHIASDATGKETLTPKGR